MAGLTYKDAGVDTKEGERAVSLMKEHVAKTMTSGVLNGLGSFGGLFQPDLEEMKTPVLVSGTDGVGTKLKIAFLMDEHDTVGIDCVAMCVNDVLCQGAKPLFFLDYIATGKVGAEKIADIVSGVAEGCIKSGCALIGGETAEMPGFYADGEYDIAGFAVGIVDKERIITGENIKAGDSIIGIASCGIHSNGYSLVRKVLFENAGYKAESYFEELGTTLGEALLKPTQIYAAPCTTVFGRYDIKGIVHITGGGFFENIPRVLPQNIGVEIYRSSWKRPAIFELIRRTGDIDEKEMFATFNMGIGMMFIVDKSEEEQVLKAVRDSGHEAHIIGKTKEMKEEKVVLK